jgi:hypothetical protein
VTFAVFRITKLQEMYIKTDKVAQRTHLECTCTPCVKHLHSGLLVHYKDKNTDFLELGHRMYPT